MARPMTHSRDRRELVEGDWIARGWREPGKGLGQEFAGGDESFAADLAS